MEFSLWLLFVATFVSVLAIPGPNAANAIAQSARYGARHGLIASAGFAFASGLNIVIVMAGLGLLLSQFMGVLIYLKWMGVAYLIYMAYKTFKSDPQKPMVKGEVKKSKAFGFAVLVSLSNPKVVLFNMMLLPLFLVPEKPMLLQGAVITITGTVLSFAVYSAYALLASKLLSRLTNRTTTNVIGSAYLCAAGALATIQE